MVTAPNPGIVCSGDSGGPVLATPNPNIVGPIPDAASSPIVGVNSAAGPSTPENPCSLVSSALHVNTAHHRTWIHDSLLLLARLSGQERACNGLPIIRLEGDGVEFRGTGAAECIIGTDGDDNIRGGGGDDIILGRGGNDRIYGNGGNDLLYGNEGNDVIFGNNGLDTLLGGPGNDRLSVCSGDNTGCAEEGREFVDGGIGSDKIYIMGDDVALGGPGNDQIFALGNTFFAPYRGYIVGGGGNDTIRLDGRGYRVCPGPGADRIRGNQGSQNFFFRGADDDFSGTSAPEFPQMRESCHSIDSPAYAPYAAGYDFDGDGLAGNHGWDNTHCICEPIPFLTGLLDVPDDFVGPRQYVGVQRVPAIEPAGDCDDQNADILSCN